MDKRDAGALINITGWDTAMSKEELVKKLLDERVETGIKYHTQLPGELSRWYVYTRGSGHRILCVLKKTITDGMTDADYESLLVSAPVKTVLRGYTVERGFVVVDCEYDMGSGFAAENEEREFEPEIVNPKFALSVGELYYPGITSWPEAVEYNYFSGNHELRFILKNPSSYVTGVIRKMPVQLGLFLQDDIILLVYRFVDYRKQLVPVHGYSPFSIHLVPENMRRLPDMQPGQEAEDTLRIHLVDAGTGILKAARSVILSPEFTGALCSAITSQSKTPLADDYNERLLEIDKRYPDSGSLMEHCIERCAG